MFGKFFSNLGLLSRENGNRKVKYVWNKWTKSHRVLRHPPGEHGNAIFVDFVVFLLETHGGIASRANESLLMIEVVGTVLVGGLMNDMMVRSVVIVLVINLWRGVVEASCILAMNIEGLLDEVRTVLLGVDDDTRVNGAFHAVDVMGKPSLFGDLVDVGNGLITRYAGVLEAGIAIGKRIIVVEAAVKKENSRSSFWTNSRAWNSTIVWNLRLMMLVLLLMMMVMMVVKVVGCKH